MTIYKQKSFDLIEQYADMDKEYSKKKASEVAQRSSVHSFPLHQRVIDILDSIQSYKVKGDYCPKRWMRVLVRVGSLKKNNLTWPPFTAYLLLKTTLSELLG